MLEQTLSCYDTSSREHRLLALREMTQEITLTDLDNLPEPDELAEEIIENMEAGLESFRAVLAGL